MSEKHKARLEETIRQMVAELLTRRVKDPRVHGVSITRVELSRDLSVAKIMYTIVGGSNDLANIHRGIESCKGFIRGNVTKHLRLRVIPEFVFVYDSSLDRAMEIEKLLHQIKEEQQNPEKEEGDE